MLKRLRKKEEEKRISMKLNFFKWNKKGVSVDNFFAVITFFGLILFFIVLLTFWNTAKDIDGLWGSDPYGQSIKNNGQQAVDTFDFILTMVYFGLHLGILTMAFLLRTHPVVYVAAIILTAVLTMVAAPLSNAYEDISADDALSVAVADIPITNYIMSKLPMFEVIWSLLTAVVLFGLARSENFI